MAKKTLQDEDGKDGGKDGECGQTGNFERDLKRLEEIVRALEAGDMPLERSLALYEEGLALSKRCGKTLDQAEARIEALMERDGKVERSRFESQN